MKKLILSLGFILITCVLPVFASNGNVIAAGTADNYDQLCSDPLTAVNYPICNANKRTLTEIIQIVVKTLFFLIGIVAVIMVIFGGVRYVISGGESSAVAAAKNIILYSVIGIVVAVLGYGLVEFVTTQFQS